MVRLKITSKGQVTLKKEVLDHLGVGPGDDIEVDLLQKGKVSVRAPNKGKIDAFFGSLKNEHDIHLTIDEMNEEIEKAWAGEQ